MKRTDKYPETPTFHYHNENPKNRITGDCVYRAISSATGIQWRQVVIELAELACDTGYSPTSKKCYGKYLEKKGWTKHPQPRKFDNTKYTGREFCEEFLPERCIAHIGGNHIVAIIDGKVNDIWNSTGGCIGNYWTL